MPDISAVIKRKIQSRTDLQTHIDNYVYRQDIPTWNPPVGKLNRMSMDDTDIPDTLPFVIKGRFCGLDVTVMVDSGATHSLISKSTVMLAGNKCRVNAKAKVPIIQAANNEPITVEGTCTAKLKLQSFNQQLDLIVMNQQIPGINIIIGGDLVKKYKIDCLQSSKIVRLHYRGHVFNIPTVHKQNVQNQSDAKLHMANAMMEAHFETEKSQSQNSELDDSTASIIDLNPIKSKQQLKKELIKRKGRLIAVWPQQMIGDAHHSEVETALSPDNPESANRYQGTLNTVNTVNTVSLDDSPQLIRAPEEGPETDGRFQEKIKNLPDKIRRVLKKHRQVFREELPPGIDSKYKFWTEAIPSTPHQPPFRQMYRLTVKEEEEVKRQIKIWFEDKKILRESTSPYNSPILFVSKPDGSLRMVIDYRKINEVTVKNRFPLPRIQDLIDMLSGAKYFSSLDLVNGYRQIALQPTDIPKTAFSTPWGHYESLVLWDGLCNAPSVFSHIMHKELTPYIGQFCTVYIDDVLIFSKTIDEHADHLDKVLQRLHNANLYAKIAKCDFLKESIKFLGHIVTPEGVQADPSKIQKVMDWTVPTTGKEVMKFLGLTNYFRQYIDHYAEIAAPLEAVKQHKGKFDETVWTECQETAFQSLKKALTSAPVLKIPDRQKPFTVICDASLYGVGAILTQDGRPCAYMSKKFTKEQIGYDTYEQELTAVIEALELWRCYLEGVHFTLQTDHKPLTYYNTLASLSRRQARWLQFLTKFDFQWEHIKGLKNPADPLSRHPDFEFGPKEQAVLSALYPGHIQFNPTGKLNFVNEYDKSLLLAIRTAPKDRSLSEAYHKQQIKKDRDRIKRLLKKQKSTEGDVSHSPTEIETDDQVVQDEDLAQLNLDTVNSTGINPFLSRILKAYADDPWFKKKDNTKDFQKTETGLYIRHHKNNGVGIEVKAQIVIPMDEKLRKDIIQMCHDHEMAAHRGVKLTIQKIQRDFWWYGLNRDVEKYISTCVQCQSNKSSSQPKTVLKPLQIPERKWQSISLDLITDLPTTVKGHDCILVVVDRFSKMVHFMPTKKSLTSEGFAKLLLESVVRLHGLPESIVSDRDPRFATSEFIKEFYRICGVKKFNSTAYHPQTDGQTERMNRVLEEVLRMYVTEDHKNWSQLLPMAEFAINDAYCESIGTTPFFLNYGFHPNSPANVALPKPEHETDEYLVLRKFMELERKASTLLDKASQKMLQQENKGKKLKEFSLDQRVMLSTKNLRLPGCSKFLPRYIGPFDIKRQISTHAYELVMPASWSRVHSVFHVNLLKVFKEDTERRIPSISQTATHSIDSTYIPDKIVSHRMTNGHIQYETHYTGMSDTVNTFETEEILDQLCPQLIAQYKIQHRL